MIEKFTVSRLADALAQKFKGITEYIKGPEWISPTIIAEYFVEQEDLQLEYNVKHWNEGDWQAFGMGKIQYANADFYNFIFADLDGIPPDIKWNILHQHGLYSMKGLEECIYSFKHSDWKYFMEFYETSNDTAFFQDDNYIIWNDEMDLILLFYNAGSLSYIDMRPS